ncbi:hypothetical protein EVA_12942 [gut metagenome]|uniref:Uncharacterized protein n=1 Tax=gut metagenome TaxID=749906 RepID=J9GAZ4_9ZZZZ
MLYKWSKRPPHTPLQIRSPMGSSCSSSCKSVSSFSRGQKCTLTPSCCAFA